MRTARILRRTVPTGSVLALAAATLIATAGPALAATTALTLNVFGGPSGGGNTITGTVGSNKFTPGDPTASYVEFQYRTSSNLACNTKYQAAAPITVSNGTQTGGIITVPTANVTVPDAKTINITVPAGLALATGQVTALYNVCVYDGNTATTSDLIADTDAGIGYTIAPNRLNLNSYQGPSGGGNTISATTTGGTFPSTAAAEFQYAPAGYCTASYASAAPPDGSVGIVPVTTLTVLTSTKAAVTVPSGVALAGQQQTAAYNLCIYDGTGQSSKLISATAQPYTIATLATIGTVTPASGPAQGGTAITVSGTGFPASGMTATLGGVALTDITVAQNGQSFTATAPAHAPGGPFNLVITTQGGTVTKSAAFTYSNGIVVTPNFAPNSSLSRTWIDVRGVGFTDLQFGTTNGTASNSSGAHTYLVRGAYDPRPTTAGGTVKTNPQLLECVDVVVLDDTELICGLFLAGNQGSAVNTRTLSGCTTTTGAPAALIGGAGSTTCSFTSADVGMAISGTNIAPGTMIAAVPSATTATLSKNSTAAVTALTTLTETSTRTITDGAITQGQTSLSSTAAPFIAAEIGHAVSAPGVLPTGTVITAVNNNGVATVSNAALATAAGATTTMNIFTAYAIPNGTYTVTVVSNGTPNAQSVTGYTQSIITSGSTFTVADYLR